MLSATDLVTVLHTGLNVGIDYTVPTNGHIKDITGREGQLFVDREDIDM